MLKRAWERKQKTRLLRKHRSDEATKVNGHRVGGLPRSRGQGRRADPGPKGLVRTGTRTTGGDREGGLFGSERMQEGKQASFGTMQRRASCAALWPQPSPVSIPGERTAWCEGHGACYWKAAEPRRSNPVRAGGAKWTAVGVERPGPPERIHARRRIDCSGWSLGPAGSSCIADVRPVSTLSRPPLFRSSSSIFVRQLDVARGPWLAHDAVVKASPVGTWPEIHIRLGNVKQGWSTRPPKNSTLLSGVGCVALCSCFRFIVARLSKFRSEPVAASHWNFRKCQLNPSRHDAVSRSSRVQLVFNLNGIGCREAN